MTVYFIRFPSDFGHLKNCVHTIKDLSIKMAECEGIQPKVSSVS